MDVLTAAFTPRYARAVRGRGLRVSIGLSLAVHAALIAGGLAMPKAAPVDDVLQSVDIDVVAPPPDPVEPPKPEPPATRPPAVTRMSVRIAPQPVTEQVPAAAPTAEPPAAVAEAAPDPTPGEGVAVPVGPFAASGPRGTAVAPGPAQPAGPPPEAQRRALADRYRDELLRPRIHDHFHYPAEARDLELVGKVIVRVTIDRQGRLLAARLAGQCPHALLCEDGLRTVRAAAPYPALPVDLGASLQIEVPLNYDFQ